MKKVVVCIVSLVFISCATEPVAQKVKEKMKQAEIALEDGEYELAKLHYTEALELNSSYNPAKLGIILSDTFSAIQDIKDTIETLAPLITLIQQAQQQPQQNTGINLILKNFLESALISTLRAALDCSDKYKVCFDEIEKDPSFSYTIDSLPLKIEFAGVPLLDMDFGGTYNLGEVYFLEGIYAGIVGTAELLYTIDLNIDILGVFGFVFNSGLMDVISTDPLNAILKTIATILNTNPNFLTFNGNVEDLLNSQAHMKEAFESLIESINHVLDKPYEPDTILTKSITTENAILFRFQNRLSTYETGQMCDESEKGNRNICVKINVSSSLASSLQDILNSFEDSSLYIGWATHTAPPLATLVQVTIDSGLILDLLNYITSLMDLDPTTQELINTLKTFLTPGLLSTDLLTGVLTSIIPDVLRISPAKLYEAIQNNNFSLRKVLPVWTKYYDYSQGYPTDLTSADTIWMEWECGTETVPPYMDNVPDSTVLDPNLGGFVCKSDATLTDSEHFTDTTVPLGVDIQLTPIQADNFSSILPYIYLIDPTFAGIVQINFSNFSIPKPDCGNSNANTWHTPNDNCEVNAFIHKILNDLIGAFQGGLPF